MPTGGLDTQVNPCCQALVFLVSPLGSAFFCAFLLTEALKLPDNLLIVPSSQGKGAFSSQSLMANMLGIKFTDTVTSKPRGSCLVTDQKTPGLSLPHPVRGVPWALNKAQFSGWLQDLRDSTLPRLINPPCLVPLGAVISEHL